MNESQATIARYRDDPVQMVREKFGVEPDAWQVKALRAFARQDVMRLRLALAAAVGPGKSAVLAWCGWNFLVCYTGPGRHPSGICISESWENLQSTLWKELAVWRARWPFLVECFEQTTERIFAKEHPKTWFLAARSWPRKADAEAQGRTLSGLHSDFILYLIDESGDIPVPILRSAEQGFAGCHWGRIVQAGNPTSHDGMLYHASAEQPHLWELIRITGDPDDPDRSSRIPIDWAREQIAAYGRHNAWVMAAILGQFPPTAVNALLGPDDVEAAMNRHLRQDEYHLIQKRIGIDVARFGDDATVLAPRQGRAVFNLKEMRGANTQEVAAAIVAGKQKFGSEMELIDATGGYAAGIVDACQLGGVPLYEVQFSGKADDERYFNLRSEMAFRMAEHVKTGGALPRDPQLKRELCALRFWYEKGKFRIVEKDQIKKQLNGHSPDRADALMCTFALPDLPARIVDGVAFAPMGQGAGKVQSEWDPYAERGA